ncbi:MAG: hypothetical protein C5B48_01615 [Candidatus Rokuibacteriota bacterium]|nr:MAG: hypothetical protein C5B48_01615 [Candidatus Rokubacteria bacterium]
MADELVRIEIGFRGGEGVSARVPVQDADRLEERLRVRDDGVVELSTQDARYLVVLSQVLYVKRHARESRVGFTSA